MPEQVRSQPWVLVAGLLAAAPIVVATGRAINWGWSPAGDEAVVAARSLDILSTHPPLLGQYSQASSLVSKPTFALGPLLYWVLTVPAHLGPAALVLAMGAVNAASVTGAVVLAGRRGGSLLAISIAVGSALVMRSLPLETAYSVWNPYVALFPLLLLLFVAWSVACGEHRLVPVLAVLASYVAQAHMAYVVPTAGALVVALGGLVIHRRSSPDPWSPDVRRFVLIAALAGLVCWSAPIAEQVLHRPGNLVLVARSAIADRATLGAGAGWHAVVRTVGIPPWWLRDTSDLTAADVRQTPPAGTTASALLVLAVILVALYVALSRRRFEVAAAPALSLVLCISVGVVAIGVPADQLPTLVYSVRWASPAGMWVWLTTAWAVFALLPVGRRMPSTRSAVERYGAVAIVSVASAWAIWGHDRQTGGLSLTPLFGDAAERVADKLPDGITARLDVPDDPLGRIVAPAIAYALRREGTRVLLPETYAPYFGARYYVGSASSPDAVVGIGPAAAPVPAGARLLGRFPPVARITLEP